MYARVARFTGIDRETMEKNAAEIRSSSGPPEGVPGKAFKLLVDEKNGTAVAIGFFDTEEDMRKGDEVLNTMSPPAGEMGTRVSADLCEIKVEVEAP